MATAAESCVGLVGCAVKGAGAIVSGGKKVAETAEGVADTATSFAQFWTDPFGNTFRALQSAAQSLATDILPVLTHATLPDLTQQWWVSAYAVTFALAMFVMVLLLFPNMLAVARGRAPGTELFEQFTVYVPLFLAGAIFGPPLGIFLVKFFGALTDSIAAWGIGQSADEVTQQMERMLGDGDASGITGGVVVGIGLMLCMLVGLMLVLLMLIVQLLTLYFTGILFPLAWVWIIQRRTRQFGYKIAFVWLGILASHPLMFLLLGVTYQMIADQVTVFEGVPSLERLVMLTVSILALLVAGTAPFTLLKLAPVMPFGNNAAGPSTSGSREIGDKNLNETTTRNRVDSTDAGSDDTRSSARVSSDESPSEGTAPAAGPRAGASGPEPSATGATSTSEATSGQQGASAGADAAAGESVGTKGAAGATKSAAGAGGTGAAAGAGAGAEAGAGAATAAEAGGAVAVGATGVGAAALAAAYAAKTGYDKSVGAAQGAVDMTSADVDGYDGNGVMEDR